MIGIGGNVEGIDLSKKMIGEAKKWNTEKQIEYRICKISERFLILKIETMIWL